MSAAVVVTEGILPVAAWNIEKIRCWEFVDLALLLESGDKGDPPGSSSGCTSPPTPPAKTPRTTPSPIRDLTTWPQAYSRVMTLPPGILCSQVQLLVLYGSHPRTTQFQGGCYLLDQFFIEIPQAASTPTPGEAGLPVYHMDLPFLEEAGYRSICWHLHLQDIYCSVSTHYVSLVLIRCTTDVHTISYHNNTSSIPLHFHLGSMV